MSLSDEKSHLRRQLKTARSRVSATERQEASHALCERLWAFLQEQPVDDVGVFLATSAEISLDPLIEMLLEAGRVVAAPRIDLGVNTMSFFQLRSLSQVQIGPWNLREPLGDEEVKPSLLLVPGLAFDKSGHRLGMGAGWYDRTISPTMTTIGICYDWQIIPRVPVEDHDLPMNWVFSGEQKLGPF